MENAALLKAVAALLPNAKVIEEGADRPAIELTADALFDAAQKLHDTDDLKFDMLLAHTAIDRIENGKFELIYQLYSTAFRHFLMISVLVDRENPVVPSLTSVWMIAEWQEREVYDLFGVLYDNHPDLRRLFLEDDWVGHPLRKDYKDDFMLDMD